MDYKNEVEDLLSRFSEYKKEAQVMEKVKGSADTLGMKIKFLEYCLDLLDTYQKELVMSVCVNGISIRKYSQHTGMRRNFISKEKNKVISLLARFFEIKFTNLEE